MEPEIQKSTRHAKITGDFSEALVLYWLSKHGFECAKVDHTGIDLIARNPINGDLMGISVKSRSRNLKTAADSLYVPIKNYEKALRACKAFGCIPYFAIVVDAPKKMTVFLMSVEKLKEFAPPRQRVSNWKMNKSALEKYAKDENIFSFELDTTTKRWWKVKET